MNQTEFDALQKDIGARVQSTLNSKREEYADDYDVLQNFHRAAHLEGTTAPRALMGMMAKHTVSLYDMVRSDEEYSVAQWDEKIVDHINYLILLKATVLENNTARD